MPNEIQILRNIYVVSYVLVNGDQLDIKTEILDKSSKVVKELEHLENDIKEYKRIYGEDIEYSFKIFSDMKSRSRNCRGSGRRNAREYAVIGEIVGNLPEEATVHFENGDLWSATTTYNEAIERLMKAGMKTFPLIEWKKVAYRIKIGAKSGNESSSRL